MLTALAAVVLAGQAQTMDLPKMVFEMPVVGGQREMILGPSPKDSVLLNGFLEREVAARHIATPANTGDQYMDSWTPGGMYEDNLGYFDCSARQDTLFDKPCIVISTTAKWKQKYGKKPHQMTWDNYAKQQWWVTSEGTILRHYSTLQTPDGTQTGDCVYGKDSIQRRYTDVRGSTSFGEIFPSCGMDALNAQFKPMYADGKLLMRDKDFCVINPLTGGIDKYSVHSAGTFKGTYLDASFKGHLFEIDGPNKLTEKAFLDDSGDLIKVALDDERFFVISVVPTSHLDENGRPIRKSGG